MRNFYEKYSSNTKSRSGKESFFFQKSIGRSAKIGTPTRMRKTIEGKKRKLLSRGHLIEVSRHIGRVGNASWGR